MTQPYLPNEIIFIILNHIRDTSTYLSCRLVCNVWYNKLNDVLVFKNNKLFQKILFDNNQINYYNNKKNLIKNVTFNNFGSYELKEYNLNNKIIKKIKNKPPYTIESHIYNYNYHEISSYHIDYKKLDRKIINIGLPGCNIS